MTTIPLDVDDLNDDGASYMLEQLYGLAENCISSWAVIGPTLERNKVSVEFSPSSSEWDAFVEIAEAREYSSAANPRLAVARVLVKKAVLENPSNTFALKLPLRTALEIGLKRDGLLMDVLRLSGEELDEELRVVVELRANAA